VSAAACDGQQNASSRTQRRGGGAATSTLQGSGFRWGRRCGGAPVARPPGTRREGRPAGQARGLQFLQHQVGRGGGARSDAPSCFCSAVFVRDPVTRNKWERPYFRTCPGGRKLVHSGGEGEGDLKSCGGFFCCSGDGAVGVGRDVTTSGPQGGGTCMLCLLPAGRPQKGRLALDPAVAAPSSPPPLGGAPECGGRPRGLARRITRPARAAGGWAGSHAPS